MLSLSGLPLIAFRFALSRALFPRHLLSVHDSSLETLGVSIYLVISSDRLARSSSREAATRDSLARARESRARNA